MSSREGHVINSGGCLQVNPTSATIKAEDNPRLAYSSLSGLFVELQEDLKRMKICNTCEHYSQGWCDQTAWSTNPEQACNCPIEFGSWKPLTWSFAKDEKNYMPEEQTQRFIISKLEQGFMDAECRASNTFDNMGSMYCEVLGHDSPERCTHTCKGTDFCPTIKERVMEAVNRRQSKSLFG